MTSEELWEKKGTIGLLLVLSIFVGGIIMFGTILHSPPKTEAVATLIQIKKVGFATVAYDITVYNKKDKKEMFRQRILNPQKSENLQKLTRMEPGDSVKVIVQPTEQGMEVIGLE